MSSKARTGVGGGPITVPVQLEPIVPMVKENEKEKADWSCCWKVCPKVRYRRGHIKRKCHWKAVLHSLGGCFCCYFDCCPVRAFLLAIAAARIYLCLYIWHTSRVQDFYSLYYTTNYLAGKTSPISRGTATFEFCWHSFEMIICLVEICLYTRLFTGALLIFPKMGWVWFYSCWAVSLCSAILSGFVIWVFNARNDVESGGKIVFSTLVVFYEMWLWAFYSKQIHKQGDTYKGIHMFVPEAHRVRASLNPRIFYEVKQKVPFDVYHGWNDNSYSLAHEFLLTNNKFSSPQPPRKVYTKLELSKRMTGLTNQELDAAIEEHYNNPKSRG